MKNEHLAVAAGLMILGTVSIGILNSDKPKPVSAPPTTQAPAPRLDPGTARIAELSDQAIVLLGSALYECRAGRQWEGFAEWKKKHPDCGADCVIEMLGEQ